MCVRARLKFVHAAGPGVPVSWLSARHPSRPPSSIPVRLAVLPPLPLTASLSSHRFTPNWKCMSEQIQNLATLNPFDDKLIDDNSATVASAKSVPSKIRKSHSFPSPLSTGTDDNYTNTGAARITAFVVAAGRFGPAATGRHGRFSNVIVTLSRTFRVIFNSREHRTHPPFV